MFTNDGEMMGRWMLTTWNTIIILESMQWNKIIAISLEYEMLWSLGTFQQNWNIAASEKG